MNTFEELRTLIRTLNASGLDYALCGGFALAVHGIVRATEDFDLLLERPALPALRVAVEPLGYRPYGRPMSFKDGRVKIRRFVKTDPPDPDFLVLDVLLVSSAIRLAWETRSRLQTDFGPVPVVSRAGLVHLKSLRGSGQDLDDIQKLKTNESR